MGFGSLPEIIQGKYPTESYLSTGVYLLFTHVSPPVGFESITLSTSPPLVFVPTVDGDGTQE